jgi:CheY-like chemotaxis protein
VLDVNEVLRNVDRMLRCVIAENIEFRTVPAPDLGHVRGDQGQLSQVIMNLAINARDAMPDGGKLTIETQNVELHGPSARPYPEVQPGRYVMLAVSDTGSGIEEQHRSRIFEPFFTTKGPNRGTGLGLSTVFGIVSHSGGGISLYSEVGHGTTFKVYLPRTDEGVAREAEAVEAAPPKAGSEVVLVVEDDSDLRALARDILADAGYTVLDAPHGGEACLVSQRHLGPIHLMVTDVVMPRMNGRETFERVAPLHPGMKVLYMSGYADSAIWDRGMLEQGVQFLQKPFTPDGLVRKVREVLQAPVWASGPVR